MNLHRLTSLQAKSKPPGAAGLSLLLGHCNVPVPPFHSSQGAIVFPTLHFVLCSALRSTQMFPARALKVNNIPHNVPGDSPCPTMERLQLFNFIVCEAEVKDLQKQKLHLINLAH